MSCGGPTSSEEREDLKIDFKRKEKRRSMCGGLVRGGGARDVTRHA